MLGVYKVAVFITIYFIEAFILKFLCLSNIALSLNVSRSMQHWSFSLNALFVSKEKNLATLFPDLYLPVRSNFIFQNYWNART